MNTVVVRKQIEEALPSSKARIAGVFYLLTFLTGGSALFVHDNLGFVLGLMAGASYIAVTLLFYYLFKPVNRTISLVAACISLVGCAIGPLSLFLHFASRINPLVLFGFYCLLLGYLVFRSVFLPRILGALLVFASMGWLTFLSAPLANYFYPYNLAPGILGEGALTLWLLIMGVNEQRWRELSAAARRAGAAA